jgi:hypothetical protein
MDEYVNNMDMEHLVGEDGIYEENEFDLIESFELKNSTNIKMIGEFIITYIDYINDLQGTYDELTNENINLVIVKDNKKRVENTLRSMEWLVKEGNEETNLIIRLNMKLGNIDYKNLTQHLENEYGKDFYMEEPDEDAAVGNYDEKDDGGMSKRDMDMEMPRIRALDDFEDGDMDYDNLAVGEED